LFTTASDSLLDSNLFDLFKISTKASLGTNVVSNDGMNDGKS
jgi:hypothetical protein